MSIGLALATVVNLSPLVWGVLASVRPETQLLTYPPRLLDFTFTLDNYRQVLEGAFLRAMANTACYATASVLIGLLLGTLAAFAFCRLPLRGGAAMFLLVVASIPLASGAAALIVPNYLYFTFLGLTNHWFTLPLIYISSATPMTIWIIKGAMEAVPRELDEAAHVDGASRLMVFSRIVLPLCLPGLGAAGLFIFIHAWNEFVAGSVMVDTESLRPVQVMVYQFIGFFSRDWGALTASATLAMAPVVLLYGLFGRLMISGLTVGSVKG
jgi:multiple sugar transport system permease protein